MIKILEYKGYKGSIEFSQSDDCYYGQIQNIDGLVSYEGDTIASLEEDFKEAVNDYIEYLQSIQLNKLISK